MLPPQVQLEAFQFYGFECHGLFAQEDLPVNTPVWVWDTVTEPLVTFTRKEVMSHPDRQKLINFSYMVNDDCFATTTAPEEDACWYFNHSCDPNCWFEGDGKIVTRRAVKKGEQLCYDYACTETESSLHVDMNCRCGAETCRGQLKFNDWRSRGFMKKNLGHVTDYIMRKHAENGYENKRIDGSWYDTRMELRYKSKSSMGLFCREVSDCKILKGEIVLMFSGKIVHKDTLLERGAMTPRDFEMSLQVQRDLWQIPAWKETGDKIETSDYINHSCDPSCGMLDSVTVVAIRDLHPGEEITIDYCMVNDGTNSDPSDNFTCMCGSVNCRTTVTTLDWQIPELQTRLGQFFAPFVKRVIEDAPFATLVEIQVYRAVWTACWPIVRWLVRAKDTRRKVPASVSIERTGDAIPPGNVLTTYAHRTHNILDHFRSSPRGVVWIHGASVGECLSALPLIKVITDESKDASTMPPCQVLVTTTTPSARALLTQRLDMHRFQALGLSDTAKYIGDLKFCTFCTTTPSPFYGIGFVVTTKADMDATSLDNLKRAVESRVVWTAASTHQGEEALVVEAHVDLLRRHPRLLLVLIPRHPHRGETQMCYEVSRVAFVGGSLVPIGGHNVLEPLRSGCTVLHGPHMANFTSVVQALGTSPHVVQVTASTLVPTLDRVFLEESSTPSRQLESLEPIQRTMWTHVYRFLNAIQI
ncbi:hypothetical protein DYB38_006010 [Aphanomyces astaci]|uniref:Uncharacterized protein n=2 Tax=Aphanomyces astaci TaxID=112090 RepID=A0A397DNK6_APHAT|nr:hypothetical protein DYB38_006010 [Aphanomyces astaci]